MKILSLIITQKYFDEIITGTKKEEFREVKPTTEKKYVVLDEEGSIIDIIKYDAIQFYVGYNKNRDSALVEVIDAELREITDENGDPIYYDYKGEKNMMIEIIYSLGKNIRKTHQ